MTPSSRESLRNVARLASAKTLCVPSQARYITSNIVYDLFCVTCLWPALLYISFIHASYALPLRYGWLASLLLGEAQRRLDFRASPPQLRGRCRSCCRGRSRSSSNSCGSAARIHTQAREGQWQEARAGSAFRERAPGAPASSSSELTFEWATHAWPSAPLAP